MHNAIFGVSTMISALVFNSAFWLLVASAGGSTQAAMGRDYVAAILTPAEVYSGQRAALDWQPRRNLLARARR